MTQYALIYRSTPQARSESMGEPGAREKTIARWRAWIGEIEKRGQLKSAGEALDQAGAVVRGNGRDVTDGPYAEVKEVVGGFSIVEAKDIGEAARIASGCPILERGGSVEVRPLLALG